MVQSGGDFYVYLKKREKQPDTLGSLSLAEVQSLPVGQYLTLGCSLLCSVNPTSADSIYSNLNDRCRPQTTAIADSTVCLEYSVSQKKSILLLLKMSFLNFLFEALARFYFDLWDQIYVDQHWSVSTEADNL